MGCSGLLLRVPFSSSDLKQRALRWSAVPAELLMMIGCQGSMRITVQRRRLSSVERRRATRKRIRCIAVSPQNYLVSSAKSFPADNTWLWDPDCWTHAPFTKKISHSYKNKHGTLSAATKFLLGQRDLFNVRVHCAVLFSFPD